MRPNLPQGTRVVTRSELTLPDTDRTMPAGAVGVIVRRMDEENLRVRFPEGIELTLPAAELDLLKHVKDEAIGLADPRDLEQYVVFRCIGPLNLLKSLSGNSLRRRDPKGVVNLCVLMPDLCQENGDGLNIPQS